MKRSTELITECLKLNPKHPRANYLRGIDLKEQGDFEGAIAAYQKAIDNYPKTAKYHLNETYNNLGTAYFDTSNFLAAKAAWEQALVLMPADSMVKNNLIEFIYGNPDMSLEIRSVSPFVVKFFRR